MLVFVIVEGEQFMLAFVVKLYRSDKEKAQLKTEVDQLKEQLENFVKNKVCIVSHLIVLMLPSDTLGLS
jgi:hypothetical protein